MRDAQNLVLGEFNNDPVKEKTWSAARRKLMVSGIIYAVIS